MSTGRRMRHALVCMLGWLVITLVIEGLGTPTWTRWITVPMLFFVYIASAREKSPPPHSN